MKLHRLLRALLHVGISLDCYNAVPVSNGIWANMACLFCWVCWANVSSSYQHQKNAVPMSSPALMGLPSVSHCQRWKHPPAWARLQSGTGMALWRILGYWYETRQASVHLRGNMAGAFIPSPASPEMWVCQILFVYIKKMGAKNGFTVGAVYLSMLRVKTVISFKFMIKILCFQTS